MDEKTIGIFGTIAVILLGVIGSLLAWCLGGKDLQGNKREVIRQMLNFEITLIIVSFLAIIPLVGLLVGLAVLVANIIFAIKSFNAFNNDAEFKAPAYQFVK